MSDTPDNFRSIFMAGWHKARRAIIEEMPTALDPELVEDPKDLAWNVFDAGAHGARLQMMREWADVMISGSDEFFEALCTLWELLPESAGKTTLFTDVETMMPGIARWGDASSRWRRPEVRSFFIELDEQRKLEKARSESPA